MSKRRFSLPGTERNNAPLPRDVKVLGLVSLAQDTGSEMLYPLLPTFITSVLGAPVLAVGVAEGLADATAAVMKLVAGKLASGTHRRRWIAAGYALATVGKLILAVAFGWPIVLFGRVVDRLGKGIRGVPRDALIADVCAEGSRGRAFGLHRSLDSVGAVIGPMLGLGLYQLFGHRMRPVLAIAIVPAFISVLLVGFVHDVNPQGRSPEVSVTQSPLLRGSLPKSFWQVMAPLGLFAIVNSTDALLLQRAHELGLDVTRVVLAYVGFNIVYATLGYPAGKLADRIAPRIVVACGLIIFGLVYLGLGQSTSSTAVWILLPLYGVYPALTDGVSRAWISDLVPTQQRTWALGVHGATVGFGTLLAGLWSGLIWKGTGRLPLRISGAVALLVATWLLIGASRAKSPTKR
jgi:MFS family permease